MEINEIVARRTDLSTFLVHLTRDTPEQSARKKLVNILTQERLIAGSPFGSAFQRLQANGLPVDSQRCVCFTETPLEHVILLTEKIEWRQCQFEPYGVAITKKQARRWGVNPVWYVDITPGHDWLMNHVNSLIDAAIGAGGFDESPIARLAPFIEQMGSGINEFTGQPYKKEFWWEREWRFNGEFLPLPVHIIVLCPQQDIVEMRAAVDAKPVEERVIEPVFVDPRWSLEKIIGRLAGFGHDDLGPF